MMTENCEEGTDEPAVWAMLSRNVSADSLPHINCSAETASCCWPWCASSLHLSPVCGATRRFTRMFFRNSFMASLSPSVMTTDSAERRWARRPFRPSPAPSYRETTGTNGTKLLGLIQLLSVYGPRFATMDLYHLFLQCSAVLY